MPVPTMRAVGVAKPRAQGHAITSVATVAKIASIRNGWFMLTQGTIGLAHSAMTAMLSGMAAHKMKVVRAIKSTAGTKYPVTLSANSWMGTLVPWASSTIFIT